VGDDGVNGHRDHPGQGVAEVVRSDGGPSGGRGLVEGKMALKADAAEAGGKITAPRKFLGGAVQGEGCREDDVLRPWLQVRLDQVDERTVEAAFEAEGMAARERPALPVEPVVHAEEAHVIEQQPGLVHAPGKDRELADRAQRHDERDLPARRTGPLDLVP